MDIEEAENRLFQLKQSMELLDLVTGKTIEEDTKLNIKAIETVLSELEKKEAIINEIAKAMNYSSGTICSCCNKKRNKTYKGFIWRYVNE